jgi:hypothetical protein
MKHTTWIDAIRRMPRGNNNIKPSLDTCNNSNNNHNQLDNNSAKLYKNGIFPLHQKKSEN